MYYKKKNGLNKRKSCLGHDAKSQKIRNHIDRKFSSSSSSILITPPLYSFYAFKRKRTWMCILFLGIISSTFNLVPNLVFADVNVSGRNDHNKHHQRDVKPTSWDPLTSPSDDPKLNVPSTTPGSFLDELSTPPLTTPSNYRTWKNTNRRSSKKGSKVGDDFHVVGNNEVNNRVDVDWENDVIAFEDEDEDAVIGEDENVFYYYDDGGEDSYDGKSSMEGIHDVEEEEDEEDIVVFDGDIYPKRIPADEYNEQLNYRPEIDESGPPAKAAETDNSHTEDLSTFRWRWRQRQKQLRRERRRQRQRQEERRKLQEARLASHLDSQDVFSAPSGGSRWRQNRRVDRPYYGNPDIYFPVNHDSALSHPNHSSVRQKRKKKYNKPFVSSFREQSPHQPYQHQSDEQKVVGSEELEPLVVTPSNPSRPSSKPLTDKNVVSNSKEELLPKPAALTFEYSSSSSKPPKIVSSSSKEENIARPSITHILFDETETKQPSTTKNHFDSFFVTTFSSSDDFYGNEVVTNSDFYGDTSINSNTVSNSETNPNVIKHTVPHLVPSLSTGSKQKTRTRFVKPKQPPRLRLYASHSYQKPPLHPHYGGTIRVQQQHHPTVTQLIPAIEPSGSRRRVDHGRSVDGGSDTNGGNSFFKSLLGVPSYCLAGIEGDLESKCVLTPVCWLSGGVPHKGCNSMLYTCCVDAALSRKDTFTETGRSVDNSILVGNRWRSGKEDKKFSKEPPVINEPECGITKHRAFSKRIIGGKRAKFAELPWQVHIRISSYQCGGVLLNHWYVATAAHCVHQAKLSKITVHIGEFDTKNTEKVKEPLDSEQFTVEKITLHPDFRYMLTQPDRFDIALLRLDRPVAYRDNMLPICLPTKDYPLVGKVGVVAGWGKTDNSFGKTGTNLLNKVHVPIIDNRRCRSWHRDKAIAVQLHKEMFCAGHLQGKMDACLGDSGGPLVINFDGRWTLVGITSAGFGCAVEKQPGIYHRVGKTARWISKMIY